MKIAKNYFKIIVCFVVIVFAVSASTISAYANTDTAHIINRKTSYANPQTGNTADGSTNIALGDSMANSIIDTEVLLENIGGKYYVTIGIGMMSSITNVEITVQNSNQQYITANYTITGSSEVSGDKSNHYRFRIDNIDCIISPIIYVEPMQRDVQFYIMLDNSKPQKGSGKFATQITSPIETKPVEKTKKPASTPKATEKPIETQKPASTVATTVTVPPQKSPETSINIATETAPQEIPSAANDPIQNTKPPVEDTIQSTTPSVGDFTTQDETNGDIFEGVAGLSVYKVSNITEPQPKTTNKLKPLLIVISVILICFACFFIYRFIKGKGKNHDKN